MRTLAFGSEQELADFIDAEVPEGCHSDTAKSQLESKGFTCDELDVSGRRILYCSREEQVDAFVTYVYVAELELIDEQVVRRKTKIWGMGP